MAKSSSNGKQFAAQVKTAVGTAEEKLEEIVYLFGIRILGRLVRMSPVGNPKLWRVNHMAYAHNETIKAYNADLRNNADNLTKKGKLKRGLKRKDKKAIKAPPGYVGGRFKSNWFVEFNALSDETTNDIDRSGNTSIKRGEEKLLGFSLDTVKSIHITNNVPYAYRLEFGHSTQAPHGMVRITAKNGATILRAAIKDAGEVYRE